MKAALALAVAALATITAGTSHAKPPRAPEQQPPVARIVNEAELDTQSQPEPAAANNQGQPAPDTTPAAEPTDPKPSTTSEPAAEPATTPADPSTPPADGAPEPSSQPAAPAPAADPTMPTIILGPAENPHPTPGISVRVEPSTAAATAPKVTTVKLLAPFPPKSLMTVPAGWVLKKSSDTKPFTQTVDLGNGNLATLSISPFVLTPDDSQPNAFSIREPGHLATLHYRQTETIGAILDQSTRQLEETDASLTEAINRLNQLLLSFPPDLK